MVNDGDNDDDGSVEQSGLRFLDIGSTDFLVIYFCVVSSAGGICRGTPATSGHHGF